MRAINASVMRQVNKRLILNQIRLRPISRAELAEETGLTRASVTQIVEELMSEGLVIETSAVGRSRLGRRSTQLAVNPQAGVIFSVNLSSSQCTVGVINMHGSILRQNTELVSGRTPSEVLDAIADTIARQRKALNLSEKRIFGVGVSAPGPLKPETGVLLNPAQLDMWHNLPFTQLLAQRTGLPVAIENTADAQALEQKYFGRIGESFALIRLEDSVSAGVVIRGSLYRGAPDFPYDLGLCPASVGGSCLNDLAAPASLPADSGWRSWTEVIDHAGSESADAVLNPLLSRLSHIIVCTTCAYRVGSIVLGGEVGELLSPLLDRLEAAVLAQLPPSASIRLRIADTNPVRAAAASLYNSLFSAD